MNLVIIDDVNMTYHSYITATPDEETFIRGNVNAINSKNDSLLLVDRDRDLNELDKDGYEIDPGMFEKLVLAYNNNLESGEQRLDLWKRF